MDKQLNSITQEDIEVIREHPDYFMEEVFDEKLWDKEREIVRSVWKYPSTAVKSCHGIGKSFTAARIALAFLSMYEDSKVITTAPTFRQVEDILWREIRKASAKAKIPLTATPLKTSIDVSEDWFALGLSTDEPDKLQGFHAIRILFIVDEACGVKREIFEAAQGILSSDKSRELQIGNPTSTDGVFYEMFKLPDVNKISIPAWDTPNFTRFGITRDDVVNGTWETKITEELPAPYLISPRWVADKVKRWGVGTPMWDSRIEASFPVQGDDTLVPLAWIEAARERKLTVKEEDKEQIGVDVARFGTDSTEFLYRKGPKVLKIETHYQIDTMKNANNLHIFMGFHPLASVCVDVIGIGAGVFDRIKELNPKKDDLYGINVAEEPSDKEQYLNLRAELLWGLRERFMSAEIDLSDLEPEVYEELAAHLSNIKYKITAQGLIQIESKEDMKKRGLPSPDKADALALAFGNVSKRPGIIDFMKGIST